MGFFKNLIFAFSLGSTIALALSQEAFAESRVALVIGNGAYQNEPRLVNPANDAEDVAAALRRDGFDTIVAKDLSKDGMEEATIRFSRAAHDADVALFYYSGHAFQFAGVNYLVPIDAQLTDEADLRRMIRLDDIVSDLQQARQLRILVLDSCRDDPLADQLKRSVVATRSIPLQRGLAKIDAPEGMIVAYSTQSGHTASDGDGRNSPYTAAFLKNIETKEEIGTIFRRISADVYNDTNHKQLPELSLSFIGEFYLRGKLDINANLGTPPGPPDMTRDDFHAAESVDTVSGWDAFLAQHPTGYYATLARERRGQAAARMAAPADPMHALSMKECSEKYQGSKAAGTLDGVTWNVFRKTRCGGTATIANAPTKTETAKQEPATPIAAPAKGGVVFPRRVDPKYVTEGPSMARMHSCLDQYHANMATGANGALKWVQRGGGYYSECNNRLKGAG